MTVNEAPMPGYKYLDVDAEDFDGNYLEIPDCSYGQAVEIYAPTILDYLPMGEHQKLVEYWSRLLSIGGKIILGGTDLYMICRSAVERTASIDQVNKVLFYKKSQLKSLTSLQSTRRLLESLGLEIVKCDLVDNNYAICGKRTN